VALPTTQSIRLRWRPELRFYEQRIKILRDLEEQDLLQAFRVTEETVDAELPNWCWLSIAQSGLTLDWLTETDDTSTAWTLVQDIVGKIKPRQFSHARTSYQHVIGLPLSFDEALARSREQLYSAWGTEEVTLTDWALLADLEAAGPPPSKGQVEFGITRSDELPARLNRVSRRGPGMMQTSHREWKPEEFKDVSLYADSDFNCPATEGDLDAFLERAEAFWDSSRSQIGRFLAELGTKLASDDHERTG
jgi:hypothetical protein